MTEADCAAGVWTTPEVHLRYFGVQGVAETIRHVMALGGMTWSEDGYEVDFSKFKHGIEVASPEFAAAKRSGALKINLGRAPVVVVDGQLELGQSKTIERYLARRLGVLGANEIEAAQIDMLTEHIRDLKDKYQKAKASPDKEAAVKTFFDETMPSYMEQVEKSLPPAAGGAALVGKSLSLADVTLLVLIKDFFDNKVGAAASLKRCPRLSASVAATETHAGVAQYRASRKNKST